MNLPIEPSDHRPSGSTSGQAGDQPIGRWQDVSIYHPRRWFIAEDGRLRPFWRAILFFVVSGFAVAASGMLLVTLLDKVWPGSKTILQKVMVPPLYLGVPLYAAIDIALLLCSWLFLARVDRRSFRTLGIWFYAGWAREFFVGAALGAGLIAAVAGTLVASGNMQYHGLVADPGAALPSVFGFALFLLLPAAHEEFLLRGYLFQRLLESWGQWAAVLALSAAFGMAHLSNPSVNSLALANTVLAGVLLAIAYLKTRALWLPVGLHWGWNAVMGPLLSLPVSGLHVGSPVLRVQTSGPEWLSGGNYGPEGSIVLTIICTAAIMGLWKAPWISPSHAMQDVLK